MIITVHRSVMFPLLLLITIWSLSSLCIGLPLLNELYVVPASCLISNNSDGSLMHPYSSLQQALDHREREYHHGIISTRRTTIHLYPTYHFVNNIRLTQAHSHIRLTTMNDADINFYAKLAAQEHTHRRLSRATISGGVPVTGWTQVSGNTYSAVVPSLSFVNQLFINNQRIVRTRVPTNYSDYLHYAAPLNDSTLEYYGFQYVPGQFDYKSLTDAMVVVYHSWTESHHYIDRLIPENNTILFTNPSHHPIGEFASQGQHRFHIENLCEALISNSFCFVNKTKTIYLMTNGSYDPREVNIITSVQEMVVSIASDNVTEPVEDIIIDNVAIQHGAWNINRTEMTEYIWAAFLTSTAVFIDNATSITISNVEISHTGSYGLRTGRGISNVILMNSFVTDTGAGGVWIGDQMEDTPILANSSQVISNEISYGGNVFPCAVGILVLRATEIVVADNVVHHHRYDGIAIGFQNGYNPKWWTTKISVIRNYVYNTGQHILCDQGGIYTIGIQPGTVIHGNVVKNVYSYAVAMWGIYLDGGTSDIVVSNNVVYNTGWSSIFQHLGANNIIINNVFARASLIQPPHPNDTYPDGDVRIEKAENHTSWTYTRNIVYDTFQGNNHSAFVSNPNIIASFSNNLYYNPYDTPLLFGSNHVSFVEWQKTGKDNGSVIADPLFTGDVNQCDFFAVQSNSPAAKLGFVNITKPSKWTAGCETDDNNYNNQFYHW